MTGEEKNHKPTPWHTQDCWSPNCWCSVIVTTEGLGSDNMEGCIVPAGCVNRRDAAFIVQAVNNHDRLVAQIDVAARMLAVAMNRSVEDIKDLLAREAAHELIHQAP